MTNTIIPRIMTSACSSRFLYQDGST